MQTAEPQQPAAETDDLLVAGVVALLLPSVLAELGGDAKTGGGISPPVAEVAKH